MFSSNAWIGFTIVLGLISLFLFGTGSTWVAAIALLTAVFSGLWAIAKLEDEYKEATISW